MHELGNHYAVHDATFPYDCGFNNGVSKGISWAITNVYNEDQLNKAEKLLGDIRKCMEGDLTHWRRSDQLGIIKSVDNYYKNKGG